MKVKPNQALDWPIDYEDGVLPIAESEGCVLVAYQCEAGHWTCGWGETDGVTPTTKWTQEYADQRFCDSLRERTQKVKSACKVEPTDNQLAALVSFAYNYGKWETSTVMKAHNRGDFVAASKAFGLVNKYLDKKTGQYVVSNGLTARRMREGALYLKPAATPAPIPQVVAPETNPASGPIVKGAATAAGVTVIQVIDEVKGQLGPVGDAIKWAKGFAVDSLGCNPQYVAWIVLAIAVGTIIRWRWEQRQQGFA